VLDLFNNLLIKRFGSIFLFFATFLALFVSITGLLANVDLTARIFQILFLPITLFLISTSITHVVNNIPALDRGRGLKRILVYYCFIVASVLVATGFLSATTFPEFVSALLFTSISLYFLLLVWPRGSHAVVTTENDIKSSLAPDLKLDVEKRDFLKLVGTAGVITFIYSLFTRRGAPFLTGGPVVSTATLTDLSGNKINPAEKSITDNYSITEIDDATPEAYFGFINEKGYWYIMKEDADGSFRYARGDSDFKAIWAKRDRLNYDYFSNVF
jgi:hypothetical protein